MKTEQEIKDRLIDLMLPEFDPPAEGVCFSPGPPDHVLEEIATLRWVLNLEPIEVAK